MEASRDPSTSNDTYVVDDLIVPTDRVTPLGDDMPSGDDPADLWPLGSVLPLILVGPLLGAAQACAEIVVDKAPSRALS